MEPLAPGKGAMVQVPGRVALKVARHLHAPENNKMQLTRSGHSRWRPSQLILVLSRPGES